MNGVIPLKKKNPAAFFRSSCMQFHVCGYCMCIPPGLLSQKWTPVVLVYKVTKVTSDSWPDKEATMGTERVGKSCEKDLSVLAE